MWAEAGRISKTKQLPARDSPSAAALFGSNCFQAGFVPHIGRVESGIGFTGVCLSVSSRGKNTVGEFILISSWRQSPSQAPCAAFSSVPSSQGLVSLEKGASSESYFPMEEGCKLPNEPIYSNSPTVQTQQLFRGFTGSTKNEKSYAFYCRFSVSVLESTACIRGRYCSNSPSPRDCQNSSGSGNSRNCTWFYSADKCSSEDLDPHVTCH